MSRNTFLRIKVVVLFVGVLLFYGMLSNPSQAYIPHLQQGGEMLIAHFANGPSAVTSQQEYSGLVTITVSGIGQASSTQYSDAFYLYTDFSGNRITPVHPTLLYNWVLWINGQHAENLIPGQQVPAYQGSGEYTFQINAPGGYLTFGVGDVGTADNTGSYTVQINSPPSNSIPFFWQANPQWATHPLQTDGSCSPKCSTIGACGCTLTSAAMLFAYYGANLTPLTLSDCMGTNACMFKFGYASLNCSDGQATWVNIYDFDWGLLDREINQEGRPVILKMYINRNNEVYTHWVLVTSGHGNNAGDYRINDPGYKAGEDAPLFSYARDGWTFSQLAVYDGQPGPNSVPLVMFNQNAAPAQTNQFDKYQFKEESGTAVPTTITNTPTPIATAPAILNSIPVTNDVSVLSITGTISVYRLYETTLIVELSATSTSGDVVEMQVWTDSNLTSQWEPFNTLTWVPWAPEDNRVYVRFRDEFGNVSDDYSTSIFPESGPPLIRQIFLPIILKQR